MNNHAIIKFFHIHAHEPEIGSRGGNAVRFLDAQFAGVSDDEVSPAQGSRYGQDGYLVNDGFRSRFLVVSLQSVL